MADTAGIPSCTKLGKTFGQAGRTPWLHPVLSKVEKLARCKLEAGLKMFRVTNQNRGNVMNASQPLDGHRNSTSKAKSNVSVQAFAGRGNSVSSSRILAQLQKSQETLRRTSELLEQRVRERTRELQRVNASLRQEIQTRRQLQKQLVEISEREQRRIGQDIHDGLGQHLTGVAMLADLLRNRLDKNEAPDMVNVRRLVTLLDQARSFARQLAHGLHPVANDPIGLMNSLEQLAQSVHALHKLECHFYCEQKILIEDNDKATHLFRIAQEAINNAIRHGRCKHIEVRLSEDSQAIRLEIWNDGPKWLRKRDLKRNGIGLQIMKSRSEAVNGRLEITSGRSRGTTIACAIAKAERPLRRNL